MCPKKGSKAGEGSETQVLFQVSSAAKETGIVSSGEEAQENLITL